MRGGLIFMSTLILSLAAGLGGYSLYHQWSGGGARSERSSAGAKQGDVLGEHRPDFTLKDLDGNQHTISEWDGKVVLVNFWATWCPPCRREIPTLADLYQEHKEQGLVVLGVAIDNPAKVGSFIEQFGVPYPNLVGHADASEVTALYGNAGGALPYSVVIDRDGTIKYLHLGEIHRETIEKEAIALLAND